MIGHQALASPNVPHILSSCGLQLRCQASLALRNIAQGGKLILDKPTKAPELECPIIVATENQCLFLLVAIAMKVVIEFSCAGKETLLFSLVLDINPRRALSALDKRQS